MFSSGLFPMSIMSISIDRSWISQVQRTVRFPRQFKSTFEKISSLSELFVGRVTLRRSQKNRLFLKKFVQNASQLSILNLLDSNFHL